MIELDYTFDRRIMLAQEDSREEGRVEGRKEGREKGRVEGRIETLITQICKKLRKHKEITEIANDLEEDVEVIESICRVAEQFAPEYDYQQVMEQFLKVRR